MSLKIFKKPSLYKVIGLTLILLIAFILRFYKLGIVPDGLQQDETSIGYNAYSILKTGRDEHGVYLPQNFQAFGEYKLPGYIYSSVLPVAFFGLIPFSIRFVSAASGLLSVIVVFFLAKSLINLAYKNNEKHLFSQYVPYFTALLLAINPWHLHFSRAAFEVMLANFFILSGVLLFIVGIEKSRFRYIAFSIIFLSLSIYTYNIARAFTPLLILLLAFIFRKKISALPKRFFAAAMLLTSVCFLPFILGTVTHGGVDSASGTLIFTSAKVQAQLQEIRSYFVEYEPAGKIFFNYWILTLWQYVNNIFSHLSVNFYFINGSEHGNNSVGTTGQWYLFELPLILWGIISLYRTKGAVAKIIFAWIVSLVLITSFTREPPQATRTFFLIFPITFCSGVGLYNLISKIKSYSNKNIQYAVTFISFIVFSYFVFIYFASYYVRFPVYYAKHWRIGDRDAVAYIKEHQNEYDKIIIDQSSGFIYTSLLTYLPYPPQSFQNEARWNKEDSEGFTYPYLFGKYEIRQINWPEDLNSARTLILTTSDKKPDNTFLLKNIYFPSRPVVINIGQKIIRYPVEEIAYILIDTKKGNKK
ncbi:MAG: hypothetical protein A2857_03520 [Candidatus Levybacteria bacterium RIFCSPHIGHO2_01_FULL_36_15]|nr:MAG: hypothetical protein A2857_03520 [Candidatus Levybacteria bacterium RIFCSPHIGHO2_01_FULL_36_15]OGH37875.1 MAG: hypothetical protein A2905_02140 [Candidatus Levybacteria bacterium RIFCSPLOWO2_01_FULL_36_10]